MGNYQIGKDVQELTARIENLEKLLKVKSEGCGCNGESETVIEYLGMAKEADENAIVSEELRMVDDNDADAIATACSNGHIRRKTVNGKCYCQMCCGGSWKYFCWSNGTCVTCAHSPQTVNCGGNRWILDC
jgi:hypothetical protein